MPTKSRSRKRKEPDAPPTLAIDESVSPESVPSEPAAPLPDDGKNVSAFEGTLSVYAGLLLIVAALFPRTFKQFILLALGGAFLYRGQSRHCQLYSALEIDTTKAGLLQQVSNMLIS